VDRRNGVVRITAIREKKPQPSSAPTQKKKKRGAVKPALAKKSTPRKKRKAAAKGATKRPSDANNTKSS
jgi:hypothetical protein